MMRSLPSSIYERTIYWWCTIDIIIYRSEEAMVKIFDADDNKI